MTFGNLSVSLGCIALVGGSKFTAVNGGFGNSDSAFPF
jgi:hypothetical protein|tara:strand:+ start:395 stop:508 length:114 start_codon:yes stop_codon:yes gene_type:complete